MKSPWQPIETAPKEGDFLVYMPENRKGRRIQVCNAHPNVTVIGNVFSFDCKPRTHWMPLPPEPPSEEDEMRAENLKLSNLLTKDKP